MLEAFCQVLCVHELHDCVQPSALTLRASGKSTCPCTLRWAELLCLLMCEHLVICMGPHSLMSTKPVYIVQLVSPLTPQFVTSCKLDVPLQPHKSLRPSLP